MASLKITKEVTCADQAEYDDLKIHFSEAEDNHLWTATWDDPGWVGSFTCTKEWTP